MAGREGGSTGTRPFFGRVSVFTDMGWEPLMIHRETIEHYPGTLAELADDLGNLRYDALAQFLQLLAKKLERDAKADEKRGRPQLAGSLHDAAMHTNDAANSIEAAWQISEPFM